MVKRVSSKLVFWILFLVLGMLNFYFVEKNKQVVDWLFLLWFVFILLVFIFTSKIMDYIYFPSCLLHFFVMLSIVLFLYILFNNKVFAFIIGIILGFVKEFIDIYKYKSKLKDTILDMIGNLLALLVFIFMK